MKATCWRIAGLVLGLLLCAAPASAEWRIDLESKTVGAGETGVTLEVTAYWDLNLFNLVLPVIVREIDAGSFWAGALPYDTMGTAASGHPYSQGVTWNWANAWAVLAEEVRPSPMPGSHQCSPRADQSYDGLSPDQFVISCGGVLVSEPAQPSGRVVVTLTFNVTAAAGQFEFDTACFTPSLYSIFMLDDQLPPVDHGPTGPSPGLFTFNKGIITIQPAGGILEEETGVSLDYELAQNYPNPFNATTRIDFTLENNSVVDLEIFNILGQQVATPIAHRYLEAGRQSTTWDGRRGDGQALSSGVYFYRLSANGFVEMKKMTLMK